MAGSISNYLEVQLLNHVLKVAPYSQPTGIFIALSTSPTDDAGSITEPVGNNYARAGSVLNWTTTGRAVENDDEITFNQAQGGAWGLITHYAIFDQLTGGNMLAHGDLSAARQIDDLDTARFAAGEIDVQFIPGDAEVNNGSFSTFLAGSLLDHIFLNTAYSQPTNIYAAMLQTQAVDGDTGTSLGTKEPSGNGYARKLHNDWNAATGALASSTNDGPITFDPATGPWGDPLIGTALVDNSTGGNMLLYTKTLVAKTIDDGETAEYGDTAYVITLD